MNHSKITDIALRKVTNDRFGNCEQYIQVTLRNVLS